MTAESGHIEGMSDGTAPAASHDHARLSVTPPPLAPALERANHPRLHLLIIVAILVAAGFANLLGAPFFLTVALFVTGLGALLLMAFTLDAERRLADAVDHSVERGRQEFETLSDRMWELQESEERFRGLIDALGDLVVHRDRDGRIVGANPVFAELAGVPPADILGRTLAELGIDVGVVPDAAFAEGECLSSTDVAIQTPKGQRWFSWIELSVRDQSTGTVSHRAIARDITARKRAEMALISARERAEFASRAKSRFLATVSHEIRTPMNGIMGMAKLLADTSLSAEQRTYVGAISTSASALLALIEDLLDYSKIEAGRFELEPQPVSVRELIDNIVELLSARAYGKGIGIGSHVAPDVPLIVTADPGRLRQVLLNLIGNAIKFTDSGGVLVEVRNAGTEARRMLRFSVTDTGPGIEQRNRERIFEEFEQADGTSTRRHGGAGLGLAISKRIVASMDGTIGVESEPGAGSTFYFEVPANAVKPAPENAASALSGRQVVIVSRNAVEAGAIARTIEAGGGTAHVAATAAQASAHAAGCGTLLVDAVLEASEGRLLRRLREAGFCDADAVTLIAPTDRGMLGEFRAAGYSAFLARPVRGDTLLRTLTSERARPQPTGTIEKAASRAGTARRQAPGLSILIAEDNDINAMLARATLTKAGHRVEVVGNGRAAVDAITMPGKGRYDVVLMDLHMPVMDGLDAIGVIRRHEEDSGVAPVPIMVLSADSQETTRHHVLAHGASGFVTKPLDPEALVRAVEEQAAA
jgi:PAS domain S-box-containing protein